MTSATAAAHKFLDFVNASSSPFHAVEEVSKRLLSSGFERISETNPWKLSRSGKYFYTRNRTTLLAFVIGGNFVAGNGAKVIGAHTDSPVLKVKPNSLVNSSGFLQVGVETYGGGLWHTWFDRDLSVAGSVLVQEGNGKYDSRIVRISRPILRIPTLAIHLNPQVGGEGFKFNNQTQLLPVLATTARDQLNQSASSDKTHHPAFLKVIAEELKCDVADIRDFDLSLYDTQPSALGGVHNEFIFSPRLDNLLSSFCALEALLQESSEESLKNENGLRVVALFDNEEVGSQSERGAASNLLDSLLQRVTSIFAEDKSPVDLADVATRRSFVVSADMAHGWHPNYSDKHEPNHRPQIHNGVVIKRNANQRYATSAITGFIIQEIARLNSIPVQEFVIKNDSSCGSTIGPIVSVKGIRTVDIGVSQLSMHSIREMCGVDDVDHYFKLMAAFFRDFDKVNASITSSD